MRNDQKWAIGLTVFYLILTTTRAFDFWNENSGLYMESWKGNIVISLLGNLVLLLIIPFLALKFKEVKKRLKQNWALVLLFGYTLISCLWSDFPDIAFRRWVKIFIYFLLVLNIISLPSPIQLLRKTFFFYIYIVSILNFMMIVISKKYGWQSYEGSMLPSGIIGHKNGFGLFCAASFFVMLWYSSSGNIPFKASLKRHSILYLTLVVGLVASGSKTPLGGLLLASLLSLLAYLAIRMKLRGAFIGISLLCVLIAIAVFGYLLNENVVHANLVEIITKQSGKDTTFTGRTDIWSTSIDFGLRNSPIFGSGYGALFVGEKSSWLQSIYGWAVWGAHNGYIEIFLETGLVGLSISLLILANIVVFVIKKVFINKSHPVSLISLVLLIYFVNFFEVNILNTTFPFFIIICLFFLRKITISVTKYHKLNNRDVMEAKEVSVSA
jgi:exopolysaccharide production protein ExoQ